MKNIVYNIIVMITEMKLLQKTPRGKKLMTAQYAMTAKGVKPSVIRLAVYNYLCENRIHPTVDEIYSALSPQMPTLSKTTVYNTVNLLAQKGIVKSISIEGFRTRYDAENTFHAHCLCTQCGKVFDVFNVSCPECTLDGFDVSTKDVFYSGCCKACADRKE